MTTKERADRFTRAVTAPKPPEPVTFTPTPMGAMPQRYEVVTMPGLMTEAAACVMHLRDALHAPLGAGTEVVAVQHVTFAKDFLADYLGATPEPEPTPNTFSWFSHNGVVASNLLTMNAGFSELMVSMEAVKAQMHHFANSIMTWQLIYETPGPGHVSGSTVMGSLSKVLPGVLDIVQHPITHEKHRISSIIQHLNDHYRWSRAQIADWLDTLDVDLTFQTPPELEEAS